MNITPKQIAMARILLDLNQKDLADRLGMARKTIMRIENGQSPGRTENLEKIQSFFEQNGVAFDHENDGVKRKPDGSVYIHRGHDGFVNFLRHVHETVLSTKEPIEIMVNNVDESKFLHWEGDFAQTHQNFMTEQNVKYKIIVAQNDYNFTASKYAQYRWISPNNFNSISYYIYPQHTALIDFQKDRVTVYVINSGAIAEFYRKEFERAWAESKPPK